MPSVRLMSPQQLFENAMASHRATTSQGRGTITKGEAEKAVAELGQHPLASAQERASVVQAFLDGAEGKALSPKAREVLADFVKRERSSPSTGQRADELKATATSQARAAETTLQAAKARIDALVAAGGSLSKADLGAVEQALDGARAAVEAARGALGGVLQVADHTAQLADRQLEGAQGELEKARADLARLSTQKGGVTKKTVADVQRWLADPLAELQAARTELRGGGDVGGISTEKFPSDNEDGGAGDSDPIVSTKKYPSDHEDGGAGDSDPIMSTMKYPSDNEDGGAGDSDPVMSTMKYPSDNEDGGTGESDPVMSTMKYPSDHEDGGGVADDGSALPGPAVQPMITRKAPSDHEDGGENLGTVTLKFPSDHEDGGPGGPGGVVTTMKAPSDHEDGGPAPTDGPTGGPTVKPARVDAMRQTFGEAEQRGVKWHASMPLGQRFEAVPLKQERHPDGFAFEALIPVGALTPTAPRQDPNSVDTFWVRRTGGIAGLTQYAGPFSIARDGAAKI
jgi:hypothetical protein